MPQVRQGLATLLDLAARRISLKVIGEASNGSEAVQLARELQPDVVLMDLEMPILDGFEATRQIKTLLPAVRVVILSLHAGPEEVQSAREAGADGFVTKGASYETLLNTILSLNGFSNPAYQKKRENHG